MNPSVPLTQWLRTEASRDALLAAWSSDAHTPISICTTEAMALAAHALKQGHNIAIGHPGGLARLPLLTAVHTAALQLEGYPSPFTPIRRGPVIFLSRQLVRRDELSDIDAAATPISPALRTVRMRADGTVVALRGGRPRALAPENKLVLINRLPQAAIPSASALIVDGITEHPAFVDAALAWASAAQKPTCVFEDSARRRWPQNFLTYSSGWSQVARHSEPGSQTWLTATRRGHAAAIDAGTQPGLARAAHLLADARLRRQPLPAQLVEAATLWRRLDELVTSVDDYDAACPRWHIPTLSERLEDLARCTASDFPDGWRSWAQTCWAGIREGILQTQEQLAYGNPKAALLAELIDRELSAGRAVDLALASRTARDAALRYLANAGVPIPTDGTLNIRSLADPEKPRTQTPTLLAAPPGSLLRHRLTAADSGALNVLCYEHETRTLQRILTDNLDELLTPSLALGRLSPPNVPLHLDGPSSPPPVLIEMVHQTWRNSGGLPARLADFTKDGEAAILLALQDFRGPDDLPDDSDATESELTQPQARDALCVPLTVTTNLETVPSTVTVAVSQRLVRILAGQTRRIPTLDVQPGMLLADIIGPTTFDRMRALMEQTHGPMTRMLLAAWDHALSIARAHYGSAPALAKALAGMGSQLGAQAIADWTDNDRIGPRDVDDISRIGRIAEHAVVANNAPAIAEAMRRLRILHQKVGRAVVDAMGADATGLDDLEQLLGPEAAAIIGDTTIYRVVDVGEPISTANRASRASGAGRTGDHR